MKTGVTISSALHASLVAYALFHVSVNAFEVEPDKTSFKFESRSSSDKKGEDKGKKRSEVSKQVTKKPNVDKTAKNVGDAKVDEKSRKGVTTDKPLDTVKATPTPKAKVKQKSKTISKEPVVNPIKKLIESAPTHEVSEKTEPKISPAEKPEAESLKKAAATKTAQLPNLKSIPKPQRAPSRPKPNSAKTEKRKKEETSVASTATSTRDSKSKAKRQRDNLNFQEDTASGKASNQKEQSAGVKDAPTHGGLSEADENKVAQSVSDEWITLDTEEYNQMRATVIVRLKRDGSLLGPPKVRNISGPSGLRARFAISVRNAIAAAAPFNLPADKYDGSNGWNVIEFVFKPGGDIEAT